MVDLFKLAAANSDTLSARFEDICATLNPKDRAELVAFAAWVEANARIAINAHLFVVAELLVGASYQNIYDWAQEQAEISGRLAGDILAERLRHFYDRRIAFDGSFDDGTRFIYGALNAGGIGLSTYASCCLILAPSFPDTLDRVAYFPGDTLALCFSSSSVLDEPKLRSLVAAHSVRHLLVATTTANGHVPVQRAAWPALVCSEMQYYEAIFVGAISLAAVSCIRMTDAEHQRLWKLAFASFGAKLTEAERALIANFVRLQKAVKAGTVAMEIVA